MTRAKDRAPALVVAERLYSIDEAAELWSVSRDTIERLLRAGKLRHVTLEHRRRIPASALEAYAALNRPHGSGYTDPDATEAAR